MLAVILQQRIPRCRNLQEQPPSTDVGCDSATKDTSMSKSSRNAALFLKDFDTMESPGILDGGYDGPLSIGLEGHF
nr:hypothetical protein [Tanacetum cinerariifolium]